eukprot:2952492-Pleurochrysis_carterae.AAC.1
MHGLQIYKVVMHSELSGFVSGTLATISGDVNYQRSRATARGAPARNVVEGVMHGGVGLGRGVFHGITGLVSAPVRGAAQGGVAGFAKGLGRGLVGVAVKPTAGVFELAAKTAEGLRNTGKAAAELQQAGARLRLPRTLPAAGGALRPYNEAEALAFSLLRHVARGRYAHEPLLCSAQGKEAGTMLLLTELRLLLTRYDATLSPAGLIWQIMLRDLQGMRSHAEVHALILTVPSAAAPHNLVTREIGHHAEVTIFCAGETELASLREALALLIAR